MLFGECSVIFDLVLFNCYNQLWSYIWVKNHDFFISLKGKLVGEKAFVRIAPAISGLADRVTVHNLFKALAGDKEGITLSLWLTYVDELLKWVWSL